ncbi:FUSC family protein [Rhizobium sp. S95]|uniref:FUSC family protein n=1 Tax=Ciceribacter sichuanensis TaxID=2949647 RepID=A0AAJ1BZB3_9HYPH|nr:MULTISPECIES: FUSC family protein [unclassified Ciceribacter]MCM2394581.1 FUSC family protein [Ciceribacter sp. S95]MCO5958712.1 FUSC family protein [Ciceribacter sp. S101]
MTKPVATLRDLMTKCGFDLPKLTYSAWVALTAFLAMVVAWSLGLNHPQWAAITVFVTIQPSRGQIIEKNVYRFVGTLSGSVVGLLLLTIANGNSAIISAGLAIWSAACLFVGTLQRSYRSYGTVLAGYSAIIVAMNNVGPPDMVKWVAMDRVAAIMVGIVAGIALGYLLAPASSRTEMEQKTRRILADIFGMAAANLGRDGLARVGQLYKVTAAAAELSAELSTMSSGRSGAHHLTDPLTDVLVCATNLLLTSARAKSNPELAEAFGEIASRLHGQTDFSGVHGRLTRLLSKTDDPRLEEAIIALASSIPDEDGSDRGMALAPPEGVAWQSDWRGATQAAARIFFVTGSIGLVWALTGQAIVQVALISSAIVISLASSGVSPSRAMRDVAIGQLIAAVTAWSCETFLWAQGANGWQQVAAMTPCFLLFAFIRSHRRISLSATDYALTLLLLLTPTHAVYVETFPALAKAILAASGGLIGYIAFRFLFPINATRRRKMLWEMIKSELQAIAMAQAGRGSASAWRLRFVARFLKITNWTFHELQSGERPEITMRKGLLTLSLGDVVFGCRAALRQTSVPPDLRRAIEAVLQRIGRSKRENHRLISSLKLLNQRLDRHSKDAPDIERLKDFTEDVLAQLDDLQHLRGAPLGASHPQEPVISEMGKA